MARDELNRRDAEDSADLDGGGGADDTAGHSLALVLGLNALSEARRSDSRARAQEPTDEALPALVKRWPRMRPAKPVQTGAIDQEPLGEPAGRAPVGVPWRQGSST